MVAVAALEASINELYLEAGDGGNDLVVALTEDQKQILVTLWEEDDRFNILHKYDLVLAACGKQRFDAGQDPYQSVGGLVDLRNALVHFKPEWDTEQDFHKKLEQRLANRFASSALAAQMTGNIAWFPARCLGAGCAEWACSVVAKFSTEFSTRLGIRERFPT